MMGFDELADKLAKKNLAAKDELMALYSRLNRPLKVLRGGVAGKITFPDDAFCPYCGGDLNWVYEEAEHCPSCGQALDWDEEDEDE